MPIPTEVVGSLPRPEKLQAVFAACDKGEVRDISISVIGSVMLS